MGSDRAQAAVDFEQLLGDLSAAFVRVSVDQVDNEIERWLERIVLAMGVDGGTIAQVDPADGVVYVSHQWARKGIAATIRGLRAPDFRHLYPWLLERVSAGEAVVLSRTDDLPPEAATDRETFRQRGTNPS